MKNQKFKTNIYSKQYNPVQTGLFLFHATGLGGGRTQALFARSTIY